MAFLLWMHTLTNNHFDWPIPNQLLISCYVFNAGIAFVFFIVLLWISKQNPALLGWVFLLTSGLKFILFYVLVFRGFQEQDLSAKLGFLSFFVPYIAALTLEIIALVKILSQRD